MTTKRRQLTEHQSECERCAATPAQTRTLGKRTRTLCEGHHRQWLIARGRWLRAQLSGMSVKGGQAAARKHSGTPEAARLTGYTLAMHRWHGDLMNSAKKRGGERGDGRA